MKLLSQRAAIHFERPGRYGSFEIIACLAGLIPPELPSAVSKHLIKLPLTPSTQWRTCIDAQ